jgi:periplasmic protein TonB
MIATANTFPPSQMFTPSRSWLLALIILLHIAFFWALSNGLSISIVIPNPPPALVVDFLQAPPPAPTPKQVPERVDLVNHHVRTDVPAPPLDFDFTPERVTDVPGPVTETGAGAGSADPVIAEPRIDPRRGLSTPVYPAAERRLAHEGTVVLAVLVAENGRVANVRIEQSSGYSRLDEAAAREAYRWRLIPGTRGGEPIAAWTRVPVTFQLRD